MWAPWRSWLARRPVTAEVAGSSPVGVAEAAIACTGGPLLVLIALTRGGHGQVAQSVVAFA
jgi:hypothetical protein